MERRTANQNMFNPWDCGVFLCGEAVGLLRGPLVRFWVKAPLVISKGDGLPMVQWHVVHHSWSLR